MTRATFLVSLLLLVVTQVWAGSDAPKVAKALVVIDPGISKFNVLTDQVQGEIPPVNGVIPMAVREQRLQTLANRRAESLTSLFTEQELLEAIKEGARSALRREGIQEVSFMVVKDPTAEIVQRVRHNKDLQRVLLIENEKLELAARSVAMLSGDYRQVRITMRIHSFMRNDKNMLRPHAGKRAIAVRTLPRQGASDVVLADRVAEGGAAFLKEVSAAMDVGVQTAITAPAGHAERSREVNWVNAAGAFSDHGKIVDHVDGRLRIVDGQGNISVYVADTVL